MISRISHALTQRSETFLRISPTFCFTHMQKGKTLDQKYFSSSNYYRNLKLPKQRKIKVHATVPFFYAYIIGQVFCNEKKIPAPSNLEPTPKESDRD